MNKKKKAMSGFKKEWLMQVRALFLPLPAALARRAKEVHNRLLRWTQTKISPMSRYSRRSLIKLFKIR
jgi:hypothetical protein